MSFEAEYSQITVCSYAETGTEPLQELYSYMLRKQQILLS